MKEEPKELSESELLAKIEAAKQERASKCAAKVDEVLKEFNCILITNIQVHVNDQLVLPAIKPN